MSNSNHLNRIEAVISPDRRLDDELRQMMGVPWVGPPAAWHALITAAALSVKDPATPPQAAQALLATLKTIADEVFRWLPACREDVKNRVVGICDEMIAAEEHERRGLGAWLLTYSGKRFYPLRPAASDIDIHDVAHALSNLCRFGGHCGWHYSVAQHSVLVSRQCPKEHRLAGLLHDAAEAYLSDIVGPIKQFRWMQFYREAEARLQMAVYGKFGVAAGSHEAVAQADRMLLATEARDLFQELPPEWQTCAGKGVPVLEERIRLLLPEEAEALFLDEFRLLTNQGELCECRYPSPTFVPGRGAPAKGE